MIGHILPMSPLPWKETTNQMGKSYGKTTLVEPCALMTELRDMYNIECNVQYCIFDVVHGMTIIKLKLKCRQYPAIHTNYSCSNCSISN